MDGGCDPERCLRDVREALAQKTFAGLETTARLHREVYWHPRLFRRQFFAAWQGEGAPVLRKTVRARLHDLLRQHDYELEEGLRRELDRIVLRARNSFVNLQSRASFGSPGRGGGE